MFDINIGYDTSMHLTNHTNVLSFPPLSLN